MAEARAESPRRPIEGVVSAVGVLIAGALAILSGLGGGRASEGGLGVALVLAAVFMLGGEVRAAGLRERCGSSATSGSR